MLVDEPLQIVEVFDVVIFGFGLTKTLACPVFEQLAPSLPVTI